MSQALTRALNELRDHPTLRRELSEQGRARFLAHFTHDQVAESTVAVYREMLN